MPGFPCFLLKYAGRMHDEAYLDLIIYCGRGGTIMNADVSRRSFHTQPGQFAEIDQYVGLKYYSFISMKLAC